mmetsp:Transcript_9026/g.15998  ORF Transcript_9026/g.15998 Transcript_9026/m.15998 type:complete len:159 (+) Transcript_9026:498-974(+)
MEDDPSTSVSIHTTAGSDNSNIHDDCSAAAAVTAAKAAATKAQRMKNFRKKKKSVHSRHQNGGSQKKTSYNFDAARAQMGNATANAQEVAAFVAPRIPSPTKNELKKKGIALERENQQLKTTLKRKDRTHKFQMTKMINKVTKAEGIVRKLQEEKKGT